MKNDTIIHSLEWRYAVKKFDSSRKIGSQDWETLKKALILSPSSFGLQPWKFIYVKNNKVLQELHAASFGQLQVVDCSHFVVFAALKNVSTDYVKKHIQNTALIRNVPESTLQGYHDTLCANVAGKKNLDWAAKQAYIALGNLLNTAALLSIDTTPMEGFSAREYDRILQLDTTDYATVCACAIGYRHDDDKYSGAKKVRFSKDEIIMVID